MTFEDLTDFIQRKMTMSHIYQPLLIRALIDSDGRATLRQLAHAFLARDESQLRFYQKRIKEMPLLILTKHGIVRSKGGLVSLTTKRLTFEQKAKATMMCEQRIQEFIQKRGLALWDYRLLEIDPVPDDLRYQVLAASGGRCELCGATKKERSLDVDHILPRSLLGKNTIDNLQVLCAKCNRTKGNKDKTDFRGNISPDKEPSCVFCSKSKKEIVEIHKSVYATRDRYPVAAGHHLIIPFRHSADYFSMTVNERQDADELLRMLRNRIKGKDKAIVGFNVGANCGKAAGQTVTHAHIHLIPRRKGDTPNPNGGVRGVIAGKMSY